MSRGHEGLLGRFSSPQSHNYALCVGGFLKAKPYKERADFYAC